VARPERRVSALSTLLAGIVDYAGLYPPAALPMPAAASEYARHRGEPEAWMLGRFVVNARRLFELSAAAAPHLPQAKASGGGPPAACWRISALLGEDPAADLEAIARFNAEHAERALVDAVEGKAQTAADVERLVAAVPPGLTLYVEVPLTPDPAPLLAAVAARGARAKARTGGLVPDAVPSPEDLARFLAACARLRLPWKATAGLHHPVRGVQSFSDAPDAPRGLMHGFLNVFAAAVLLRGGRIREEQAATLLAQGQAAFAAEDGGLSAFGFTLDETEIAEARTGFAVSFGSCSFAEPVADLRRLGALQDAQPLSR
jgi:hypothetical protein